MNRSALISLLAGYAGRFSLRSYPLRLLVALASLIVYIALFPAAFNQFGGGIGAFVIIPVAITGWLLGLWAGLLAGILAFFINLLLYTYVGSDGWAIMVERGLAGHVVTIIVGLITGWLHNMGRRLQQELATREEIDRALHESREQLRTAISSAPIVLFAIDKDGLFLLSEGQGLAALDLQPGEVVGQSIWDLYGDIPEITDAYQRALQGETVRHIVSVNQLVFDTLYTPRYNQEGEIDGVIGAASNITDQRRIEEALWESERQYRSLIEQSNDAIYLLYKGRFEIINRRFSEMFGVTPEEARSPDFNFMELVAPESAPIIERRMEHVRQGRSVPAQYEFTAIHRDGSFIPVEASVSHIEYRGEIATQGIIRDVTERRQTEEALRQSEEYFRSLIENALDIITVLNRNGAVRYHSPAIKRVLGYEPEELVGQSVFNLVHPDDLKAVLKVFKQGANQPNFTNSAEFRYRHKDGSWRILEATGSNLLFNKIVQGVIVNSRDVTERRQAEEALRRRAAELEALVEISSALRAASTIDEMLPAILERVDVIGPNTSTLFLKEAGSDELAARAWRPAEASLAGWRYKMGEGITGYVAATGEIYTTLNLQQDDRAKIDDFTHSPLRHVYSNIAFPLRAQEQIIGVLHIGLHEERSFTGEEIRLLTAIAEIAGSALERAMMMETLEQRVAERTQELAQANEQLKELDALKSKFVSDVSHELRTPVANLGLYMDLLQKGKPEKREAYLAVLQDQIQRLSQLIEDVLDLTRIEIDAERLAFEPVNLNDLVQQAVIDHKLRAAAGNLVLSFEAAPDLPLVQANTLYIGRVIANLLTNAINYTPKGYVKAMTCLDDRQKKVYFRVEDSGKGIDPEDIPHIFDRFYRGRRASQSAVPGTGLGLAIVKEIVDLHGGQITVQSKPRQGSVFSVELPLPQQHE